MLHFHTDRAAENEILQSPLRRVTLFFVCFCNEVVYAFLPALMAMDVLYLMILALKFTFFRSVCLI